MTAQYYFSNAVNSKVLDCTDELVGSYVIIAKKTQPATTKQVWCLDSNAIRTPDNLYPVQSEGMNHSNSENGALNLI